MKTRSQHGIRTALCQYFWPQQSSDDGFQDARARLLCGFSGIIGVMAAFHNGHMLFRDPQFSTGTAIGSAICIVAYFLLPGLWHKTKNMVLCNVVIQIIYLAHTNLQMLSDTQYLWRQEIFLIGPPVLALLLVGMRAAWIATVVVSVNLMVVAYWTEAFPVGAAAVVAVVALTLMIGLSLFHREIIRKERRLIELAEDAQRADREKSDFLAKMSHEIRTPLNGLSGILQLLDETELTAEQKELVETGRSSGRSLMHLINDVLDYSKIAAHGVTVEYIPVASRDLLTSVSMSQSAAAKAKGLALHVDVAADVPEWISSDPTRLTQVVINLVGNSIKFSDDGTITMMMRRENDMLLVSVRDQGIGLTEEAQSRVFNKFEQASSATNRRFGGTGLGLAISKEIVELMGGEIGVQSVPFAGSTFWFRIPLIEAEAPDPDQVAQKTVPASFENTSVLVVEDNRTNQMIVRRFLESMQSEVTMVDDGRPALQRCAEKPFDLILMDIQLPDMDGVEATEILRDSPGPNQKTPIVALSANILPEQTNAYLKAGMNACLGKPFRKDELAKIMGDLIKPKAAKPKQDKPAA